MEGTRTCATFPAHVEDSNPTGFAWVLLGLRGVAGEKQALVGEDVLTGSRSACRVTFVTAAN